MVRTGARGTAIGVVAAGVGFPLVVSGLAVLPVPISSMVAGLTFVLAVTAAAVIGGSAAGLTASVLSFLALNVFFTPPVGTLSVRKTEDVVALVVFLIVSAVIGSLLSRAIAQQSRAERREREARLLQHLGGRLLSGEPAESVLARFGDAIVPSMGLARYRAIGPEEEVIVERGSSNSGAGPARRFPMEARGMPVGAILVEPDPSRPALEPEEEHLLQTFAAQMALALDASRLAADARAARTDAERSRVQAALLSSVTHDLRTPLASITASVTDLLDRAGGQAREQLETIRQEADRLNRVVGNLLDLSRIRAGALTPSKRLVGIDEVVEGVLGRMEATLSHHRVRLLVRDNLPEAPLDVVQIDQALTNILENAVKFAPAGSEIHVTVARWEGWVQVRIADQGPGIPEELRESILEPFVVDDAQAAAGTGLGLAIARAVVTAHDGQMWIEPAPGGGTAVLLRLPVET